MPIFTRTLESGMPLVVETMPGVRSAALSWLLPAGSAFDPDHQQGMTAMFAELLLRGAGSLGSRDQADAFDRLGAARAAEPGSFTMRIGCTMLGERLPDVLPLVVDMAMRPRMDYDAIDPARDLALQALAAVNDDPHERAALLLRARHNPKPLDRSGLGTEAGLAAIEREDLVMAWRNSSKPSPSVMAVAGAVDPDAIEKQLNHLLTGWHGEHPEPALGPTPPRGYGHQHDETNQVQILLAHDAPPEPHADSLLEKFVISVLSGGMAGRLFTEVREKRGLCYSVNAGYRGDKVHGAVSAYVGTTPERAQESLDVLWEQLLHLSTPAGAITPDEFARAKVGMKSGLVFSGESSSARAAALAHDYRRLGRGRSLEELATQVDAVTVDQLNAYLARRKMGTVTIQTLGPKPLRSPA